MRVTHYVLDACAVIAFLTGEEGAERVKNLLEAAAESSAEVHIHRVNLLEVYYDTYKVGGSEQADRIYKKIFALPISVEDALDDTLLYRAGELKAMNRISLADAIALALTSSLGAVLVTSDHHEFDTIEATERISFMWIR